jgi:hypothetical protein
MEGGNARFLLLLLDTPLTHKPRAQVRYTPKRQKNAGSLFFVFHDSDVFSIEFYLGCDGRGECRLSPAAP